MAKNQMRSPRTAIRRLAARRQAVLERLLARSPLVRGALSRVRQRCGKPTCHCAKEPAHVVWRLASSRAGRQRCQLIRQDDVAWVREYVARYKGYRRDLRALDAIHNEQKALLRGLMEIRSIEYE